MYKFVALTAILAGISWVAVAQQPELHARDVFWSANDLVAVSPNPGAKQAAQSKPASAEATHKPMAHRGSAKKPPSKQIDPGSVTANGYGAQPHLVKLSEERLGLRYTILLKTTDSQYREVLPSTTFHSRDRVRISVMSNQPGYLYIVQKGSSGAWSPIFPAADAARDSNHVEQGQVYVLPANGAFEFNDQSGTEKLFIVLSRQPISDLDGLIFGLRQPAAASSSPPQELAANVITDALVQQLASRDLTPVQEQVDDEKASSDQGGEKAVYVVSAAASNGPDARVIANLELDHR
jgi:Domain of unknown function (DUF4384)